jgi:membrane associated rhomboid family serine protease
MVFTPVGIKCAEHAGVATGPARVAREARRFGIEGTGALLTKVLIGVNVAVYLLVIAAGGGTLNEPGGELFIDGSLVGAALFQGEPIGVADGEWWRLVTSMFLHGFVLHIVFNMVALWYIGRPVEEYLGSLRYLLLYLVSGLAGSAGALVADPTGVTVGASGAIFGILGAMLILEWNATGRFGGAAASLIAINLVFNFAYNGAGGNISIGGHVGGLIGGILVTLAFARWGRGHAAYGKLGIPGIVGLVAVAAASILVAYLKVRNLA